MKEVFCSSKNKWQVNNQNCDVTFQPDSNLQHNIKTALLMLFGILSQTIMNEYLKINTINYI